MQSSPDDTTDKPASFADSSQFAIPEAAPKPAEGVAASEGGLPPARPGRPPMGAQVAQGAQRAPLGGSLDNPPAPMPMLDWLIAAGIGAVFACAVALTWGGYGHSWDEAYYYEPARLTREWTAAMIFDSSKPVSGEDLRRYWGGDSIPNDTVINELPALPKFAWAAGLALFEDVLGPCNAMRAPVAVAFALLLVLTYRFAHALSGRWGALAAAGLLGTMPRVWGEAHLAVAETFFALMSLATVYCFWRGLFSPRWAAYAALAFGLALNTKVQAVLLPVFLLPWGYVYARNRQADNVMAMLFLAPAVWVAAWPWLWLNPAAHVLAYLSFYATHPYMAVYYFGRRWISWDLPCPWHYPWVMTAITTPPLTLLAFGAGVLLAVRSVRSRPVFVLVLAAALFPILFNTLPTQMKYDGVRLFGSAFPPLAILGGAALGVLVYRWQAGWKVWAARNLYVLALLGGLFAVVWSNPHSLSYYNVFILGPGGAADAGMEMSYWGEALSDEAIEYLNTLPKDARVMARAFHDRVFRHLQEWGRLRADLRIGAEPPDFLLVQNRRSFWTDSDFKRCEQLKLTKTWNYNGVPLLYFYDLRPPAP